MNYHPKIKLGMKACKIPGPEQISLSGGCKMCRSAEHVAHLSIKFQVIIKYTLTKAISTKLTSAIAILMVDHTFFLQNFKKPKNLFVDVANTESAQLQCGIKVK